MITLSRLWLASACPGSASLPTIARASTAAALGTAIHALVERRVRGEADGCDDIAKSCALTSDDAGRLRFIAAHLSLPIPPGAIAEQALAYFADGLVRVAEGGHGSYRDDGQILSGQLDVMWPEGDALWLCEIKTGDEENVQPVHVNAQLRAGAVMAARWTGARKVIPALCFVNAAECAAAVREGRAYGGRWEVPHEIPGDDSSPYKPLDSAALDAIEAEMRAVLARARGEADGEREATANDEAEGAPQDREHRGGVEQDPSGPSWALPGHRLAEHPRLVLGPHCDHCPARGACPALAAEAVAVARGEGLYLPPGAALTPAAASRLAGLLPALRRTLDAVDGALRAHVEAHGPIVLADGREWGPALEETVSFLTAPTFEALEARVGEKRANEAFVGTEDRLRAALRGDRERLGRGEWDQFVADVEARGGLVRGVRKVWRKRWPAMPVEVVSDATEARDHAEPGGPRGSGARADAAEGSAVSEEAGAVRVADGAGEGEDSLPAAEAVADAVVGSESLTRAACAVCGRSYTLARGTVRKHSQPGGGLRCEGSGKPPKGGA